MLSTISMAQAMPSGILYPQYMKLNRILFTLIKNLKLLGLKFPPNSPQERHCLIMVARKKSQNQFWSPLIKFLCLPLSWLRLREKSTLSPSTSISRDLWLKPRIKEKTSTLARLMLRPLTCLPTYQMFSKLRNLSHPLMPEESTR